MQDQASDVTDLCKAHEELSARFEELEAGVRKRETRRAD